MAAYFPVFWELMFLRLWRLCVIDIVDGVCHRGCLIVNAAVENDLAVNGSADKTSADKNLAPHEGLRQRLCQHLSRQLQPWLTTAGGAEDGDGDNNGEMRAPPIISLWLAYSGGLDSSVLLSLLAQLAPSLGIAVTALHVDHGLSARAGDWRAHCESVCRQLGVAFESHAVTVNSRGQGLEDAARRARYRVFEQCLPEGGLLLTGHHLNDQAETLLLRLMRGAGPKGLAAMPVSRPLGRGHLLRPLLDIPRQQLRDCAETSQLDWIDDDSNAELDFSRNYLRHKVMPLLEQRWPDFSERWQQTAQLCRQTEQLADQWAEQDLALADEQPERLGFSLSLPLLMSLSDARQTQLWRYWLSLRGADTPSRRQLQQLQQQLLGGRRDAEPQVSWGKTLLRRYRQRLYLLPAQLLSCRDLEAVDEPSPEPLCPVPGQSLSLPRGGCFRLSAPGDDGGLPLRLPVSSRWQLRYRRGGERCRPSGRQHSQSLKKLLQEYGVEPWLRDRLPLLYVNGELAAVGDYWACQGFSPADESVDPGSAATDHYHLRWWFPETTETVGP